MGGTICVVARLGIERIGGDRGALRHGIERARDEDRRKPSARTSVQPIQIFRRGICSIAVMSRSMMMKRKRTMTAPAVTRICTAARKKALSMTNSPAMKKMQKAKQSALATGLRQRMTASPQTIIAVENIQKKRDSMAR